MATQQPARIDAMVLVSAAYYFPEPARAIMRQRHVHGDDQIRALWAHGNALKDSVDDMNFTPPYLATIRICGSLQTAPTVRSWAKSQTTSARRALAFLRGEE